MSNDIAQIVAACEWLPSQFLIFSGNVYGPLIYYSHFAAVIPTLLIGIFIFFTGRKQLPNILLLLVTLFFSLWVYSDLVLWASESAPYIMFFWTLEIICEPLVYFFAFYFFYTYIFRRDWSAAQKVVFAIPLLPTLLLAPTSFGLLGYDISNCDRAAVEGVLATYGYGIEILYALLIIIFGIIAIAQKNRPLPRRQIFLLTIGLTAFLASFSLGNIVEVFTEEWSIGQYGLFGAPIFVAFLAYLIVKFKAFNAKLFAAQALVIGVWLMVLSLLFIRSVDNIKIVTSITLIMLLVLGYYLVKSVQREVEQRERIEKLAKELARANDQQVTLIHFITHQIKGFVTKSRNIFAMISDGDYGPVPEPMKAIVAEGFRSDTQGVSTIQEILNASNIKSGKVTFKMESFDLKGLIDEIAAALKPNADAKGIAFNLDTGHEPLMYTGDRAQLMNAFRNLIDNSIKYTLQGSVGASLSKHGATVRFEINDTGVGITPDDMKNLFTEGGHGKESSKVNVESTGFGLYIVKNIIEAHKGKVWAESEGVGKGSRFIVELPAV